MRTSSADRLRPSRTAGSRGVEAKVVRVMLHIVVPDMLKRLTVSASRATTATEPSGVCFCGP